MDDTQLGVDVGSLKMSLSPVTVIDPEGTA